MYNNNNNPCHGFGGHLDWWVKIHSILNSEQFINSKLKIQNRGLHDANLKDVAVLESVT